ncbi:universal stress protein [Myxococcota bacterium]|nr:universal stress protein [Myxococcota bacterium]
MYPTAVLMLALDERDPAVVEAFLSLAPRLGLQQVVVHHVVERDALPAALGLPAAREATAPPEVQARVDGLRAALPDVEVRLHTSAGSPVEAADALQAELAPDLLVLGRGAAGAAGGAAGQALLRHARCTTLVVPDGWRPPARGAVVGVDFSDEAVAALATAARIFDDVQCLYQYDERVSPSGQPDGEFRADLERNARAHFDADVRPAVGGGQGLELQLVAAHRASEALLTRAGADRVVVIGSRGLSPLAARLLGSTAERIAARAAVPVLVVREKGKVMGFVEGLAHR